jgi:general secretion pathway protein L
MKTIGIDIGSFSIKFAEIEGQGRFAVIRDFREIPLNHDPGQDTRLDKIEALRQIVGQYDLHQNRFVVGIGSEFTTSRSLTFPFLERRKILQSLPFELEDVIPFSQSDAIFDFRTIHQKQSSTKVLAVAAPKRYIQDILNLCDDAGFSPDIVCPDGIALANLFENFDQVPRVLDTENTVLGEGAQLIVHIGYTKTLVDVIQDGTLIATRALYYGGRDLTNAISRVYQLPYLEALKGVAEKGFVLTSPQGANEDQIAFSQTIAQSLNVLVGELQRTIVDLKSDLQTNFTMGHLLGGMSRLINLGPYLTQRLEIPFGVFPQLGKATQSDVQNSEENDKGSAIAIGLAIEGIRKPKNPPINLRKNEFSKQNQTFELLMTRFKEMAMMAAALYVTFIVYTSFRASFADDNVTAIEKAIKDESKRPNINIASSQLTKPEAVKKLIKAKKDEIESKKAVVRLNQMTSALDVMKNISSSLPSRDRIMLDVLHFDLEGENMVLEGTVKSQSELDILKQGLAQLTAVSDLTVTPVPAQSPPGKLAFSMKFKVTRLPPLVASAEKVTK